MNCTVSVRLQSWRLEFCAVAAQNVFLQRYSKRLFNYCTLFQNSNLTNGHISSMEVVGCNVCCVMFIVNDFELVVWWHKRTLLLLFIFISINVNVTEAKTTNCTQILVNYNKHTNRFKIPYITALMAYLIHARLITISCSYIYLIIVGAAMFK